MSAKDRAIQFIGKFLSWYQDSYGQSDVVSRIGLEKLVKEAEEIHVEKLRDIEATLDREKELREFMKQANEKYLKDVTSCKGLPWDTNWIQDTPNLNTLTRKKHDAKRTKSGSVRSKNKRHVRTK